MTQYAIAFDLDTKRMKADGFTDSDTTQVYQEIPEALGFCGFTKHPQGSLYCTEAHEDAITALMQLESVLEKLAPTFCRYARRINVFRMEEWSDVTKLITGRQPAGPPSADEERW